jgi:putative membrane protein
MNKALTSTVLAMAASLGLAGSVLAQYGQPAQGTGQTATTEPAPAKTERTTESKARLAASDLKFLKQASQNGAAEIEASKLAQTKASNAEVKSFAQHMVEDHAKAADELKKLAMSKGVELPGAPSIAQKAKLKMLASSDGEKFDKRYSDNFGVKAHEETVKLFRTAAEKAQDADIKSFAQATLPKLEEHLTMAKTVQTAVAPAGRTIGSGTQADSSKKPDTKAEKKQY